MSSIMFDPGIDKLPIPRDGYDGYDFRLDVLQQREQLMEDIDCIIDGFFYEFYGEDGDTEIRDELVTRLCDAVCNRINP